ncbi:MAG: GAF domain-containing protein [Chloroflexota bacterium]
MDDRPSGRGSNIHSMVVAPMLDGDRRLGALGVYSSSVAAMGEREASLVRALADHAAATIVRGAAAR